MRRFSLFLLFVFLVAFGFYFNYIVHYTPPKLTETASVISVLPKSATSTDADLVPVTRVIDGDTIVVKVADVEEKVRFIGMDTPETVDPRKPVQCFGKEASDETKKLLTGQEVLLKSDPTQDNKDKYGRLLRYVYLSDGTFIDELLIKEGFAREYTYKIPYQFQKKFKADQASAKLSELGLWNPVNCKI